MVFLYCFLCLNLKTVILGARSVERMVPFTVTLPPWTISPPSLKVALTGSSISEPTSPASFSTRITSPGATRYCLPPVSTIACIANLNLLAGIAGTHGVHRNRWSKEPVYYTGSGDSNALDRRSRVLAAGAQRGPAGDSFDLFHMVAVMTAHGFDHSLERHCAS